ncbi:alpha-L-fucosidase [Streptomyces sp. NBC_01387]|uniref:alpha-L-fucosidase n=1 Tax=unclassified Streptomyces TaxID=2593676 RepID=UPI0032526507|nr:alpha-L-fucosidase [Streptomyces sp. NBC_01014]
MGTPVGRRTVLALGVGAASLPLLAAAPAVAAPATASSGKGSPSGLPLGKDRITSASQIAINASDTPDTIVRKAAHVVPRPSQVAWQQREVTAFTHFGMNTFTDREWGSGAEDEATFDPSGMDADQWMRAYKAAGARQVMFTAKHHDGFVLFPTRYTNHSVIASPWWIRTDGCSDAERDATTKARAEAEAHRTDDPAAYWRARNAGCNNPQGDVLGTYLKAARRAGLKVGVYLSPADGSEQPHAWHAQYVEKIRAKQASGQWLSIEEQATVDDGDRAPGGQGRYGSGSSIVSRTIPTLVPDDDRAAALAAHRIPSFTVQADDYNAYYLNQIYELFTQYGPIDELWLDGANPWTDAGITEKYDFTAWFRLIHALSPDTVTFAGPQGTRWVGNESGVARTTEWSVTPATADPHTAHGEGLIPGGPEAADIGSREKITAPGIEYLQWFPAEADVSLRPGWFFHADQKPKTPQQLVTLYEQSVGRNAVLLLNVPPAQDGRIAAADVDSLTRFGDAITATYGPDLLAAGRGRRDPVLRTLTDGRLTTAWSPSHAATTGAVTLKLPAAGAFDRIRLGEDITRGQQVEQFAVDIWTGTAWQQTATGTTIGYARILTLPAPVSTDRIRIRILQARTTPRLASAALHLSVPPK